MFKSFFWKNWLFVLISTIAFVVLFLGIIINYQFQREEERFLQQNIIVAQMVTRDLEKGYKTGILPFEKLGRVSKTESTSFLWVVKPDNRIFWADDPEMMGKIVPIPYNIRTEIEDSFYQEPVKLITLPVVIELGGKPWALLLGVSLKPVSEAKREIFGLGIDLLILVIMLAGLISYPISKKITGPLKILIRDLEIIGKGNLDHRVDIKTGDEIEEVGNAVNRMTKDLKESRAALEEAKTVLEIKVKARTKELRELAERQEEIIKERTKEIQERMEELEKFHRLAVGRELKMIELKEEIKELKKELEQRKK